MYIDSLVTILHWTVRWRLLEDFCCLSYVFVLTYIWCVHGWTLPSEYFRFLSSVVPILHPFPVNDSGFYPSLSLRFALFSECSKFLSAVAPSVHPFTLNASGFYPFLSLRFPLFFSECSKFLSAVAPTVHPFPLNASGLSPSLSLRFALFPVNAPSFYPPLPCEYLLFFDDLSSNYNHIVLLQLLSVEHKEYRTSAIHYS